MFSKKKIILLFSKTTITVTQVTLSNPPQFKNLMEIPWIPAELPSILTRIKKTVGNRLRLLLSEELVYVVSLSVPSPLKRTDIQTQAQELIPEDLTKTSWDFKTLPIEDQKPIQLVQVVAITQSFFEQLNKAIQTTKVEIEAIEPISYALAHLVASEPEPVVIVYVEHTTLLVMAYKGLVIATEIISDQIQIKHIDAFVSFAQNRFTPVANKVIFSGTLGNVDIKQFTRENRTPETRVLYPHLSLALKTDLIGKDEYVLNLDLLTLSSQKGKSPTQSVNKILLIVFFCVLIFGSIAIGIFSTRRTTPKKVQQALPVLSPSSQLTLTPTTSATPSARLNRSAYKIEILNGSGKEGEAARLDTILTEKGFTITTVGNAKNSDYQETIIQTKQEVNQEYLQQIGDILENIYTIKKGDFISQSETIDVRIIVGKKGKI